MADATFVIFALPAPVAGSSLAYLSTGANYGYVRRTGDDYSGMGGDNTSESQGELAVGGAAPGGAFDFAKYRGYFVIDCTSLEVVPASASLFLTAPGWVDAGQGASQSVRPCWHDPFDMNVGYPEWSLSDPAGPDVAGPFGPGAVAEFALDPTGLTLGGLTYIQLVAADEVTDPVDDVDWLAWFVAGAGADNPYVVVTF